MELGYNLFFLMAFIIILLIRITKSHQKLPPGPWKLPVLGSIHHLLGTQLPHHKFQQLSKTYGPLTHLKLGQVHMVIASSAEAAKEIMKTHDLTFATRPLTPAMDILSYHGKSLSFSPYGEYWRQLRKVCVLELLSAKRVNSFRRIREEEAQGLIKSVALNSRDGSVVNLSKMLIEMTNNMITRATIGKKFQDQDRFLDALHEALQLAGGVDLSDWFPSLSWLISLFSKYKAKAEACHQKHDQILESIVQEHKERKAMRDRGGRGQEQVEEDLADVLIRLEEEGDLPFKLTNDSIKALILDMIDPGSETASSTLQWAMSELMRNPRVMRKVQMELRNALSGKDKVMEAEIKQLNYLQLVIKETLRLHPPAPLLLPRECQKKCEMWGYQIPLKTRLVVNAFAIGRDPQYWEDAEEFKPERFEGSEVDFKGANFEFLPFGAGRRMCPGMLFGLANMELPLAQLLYHFDWEIPTDTEIKSKSLDMSESLGLTARRKFDLMLHATPYNPQTLV